VLRVGVDLMRCFNDRGGLRMDWMGIRIPFVAFWN
jgi:hypothetical protein